MWGITLEAQPQIKKKKVVKENKKRKRKGILVILIFFVCLFFKADLRGADGTTTEGT